MIDKQSIVLGYFRHGKSKKQLSRELGFSMVTIRKYIAEHQVQMQRSGSPTEVLPKEGIIEVPRYAGKERHKPALTVSVRRAIDEYLLDNQRKRDQGKHKQQLKKIDIHQALVRAGHQVSYTSVRRYIKTQVELQGEVFIRQHYEAGESTEFDWGEVKVTLAGKKVTMMQAVFTSAHSNLRWSRLYHRQDMSSFLDAHARYFAYTGGVQREVVYDNMRTAVRKYTTNNDGKTPTEGLLKVSCYYQFDYRFCNARRGNEKGHVEKSVEYVRRKAFGPKDDFDSMQLANEHLLAVCEQLNQKPLSGKTESIQSVFERELQHMKVAPAPYDASELVSRRVDKYSCIKVDTNWYSVPEGHGKGMLEVKIHPDKIFVYSPDNKMIAIHLRARTRYEYYLRIDHYLQTLHTKPGALKGSLALRQADENLGKLYENHFINEAKCFVEILLHLREKQYSVSQLEQAVAASVKACPHLPLNIDQLKIFLHQQNNPPDISRKPTDKVSKQIAGACATQLKNIQSLLY